MLIALLVYLVIGGFITHLGSKDVFAQFRADERFSKESDTAIKVMIVIAAVVLTLTWPIVLFHKKQV